MLAFLADNIAYFNYKLFDEVLNVLFTINRALALQGEANFENIEAVKTGQLNKLAVISGELSENLHKSVIASVLLFKLKAYLKLAFDVSDIKCHSYVPKPAKLIDKQVASRSSAIQFNIADMDSYLFYTPDLSYAPLIEMVQKIYFLLMVVFRTHQRFSGRIFNG